MSNLSSNNFKFLDHQVGLPAKSGVCGGLLLVIPNVLGIALWSPPLDQSGNSVRGIEFCKVCQPTISLFFL